MTQGSWGYIFQHPEFAQLNANKINFVRNSLFIFGINEAVVSFLKINTGDKFQTPTYKSSCPDQKHNHILCFLKETRPAKPAQPGVGWGDIYFFFQISNNVKGVIYFSILFYFIYFFAFFISAVSNRHCCPFPKGSN